MFDKTGQRHHLSDKSTSVSVLRKSWQKIYYDFHVVTCERGSCPETWTSADSHRPQDISKQRITLRSGFSRLAMRYQAQRLFRVSRPCTLNRVTGTHVSIQRRLVQIAATPSSTNPTLDLSTADPSSQQSSTPGMRA